MGKRGPKAIFVSFEEVKEIAEYYLAGSSLSELAIKHGYSVTIIRRELADIGIAIRQAGRKRKHSKAFWLKLFDEHVNDNISITDLSIKYKITRQSIYSGFKNSI